MVRRNARAIPPMEPKRFGTVQEVESAVEKLRRRVADVHRLRDSKVPAGSQGVKNVESNISQTILEIFGENSPEFRDHQHDRIWKGSYSSADEEWDRQEKFEAGIPESITMLEGLIGRLEEKKAELPTARALEAQTQTVIPPSRKVFLVHGQNEDTKQEVARFLEKLELAPIILHEQPSAGRALIEKIEDYSDVGYAVVLLTGDDRGGRKEDPVQRYSPRARQNVIFELGFFIGKLGRARVCPLYEEGVELPSDYEGVVYVPLDAPGAWKLALAKEMNAARLHVDLNKAI